MKYSLCFLILFFSMISISSKCSKPKKMIANTNKTTEMATLGAGCFWCVEAVFQSLVGVLEVQSGYSGGKAKDASYREVCSGTTHHAEVVQISYDATKISFEQLLEVFFQTHNPTTLNRQGADEGTQYRSVIFFHSPAQKDLATKIIGELNKAEVYPSPIVTEVTSYKNFFKAESYHQDYYANNRNKPYCRAVIQPKLKKFKKTFEKYLRE